MKRSEVERLLPEVFQRTLRPGNPLAALVEVMEALLDPSEKVLERLDATFDPRRTADAFVPFLACWVDLERFFDEPPDGRLPSSSLRQPITPGLGRLRELIAAAAYLSQWRGTTRGLLLFLKTAMGIPGFEIDEQVPGAGGRPRPFHIRVRAPQAAFPHRALVQRIIEHEKPAYVTYELEFEPMSVRHEGGEVSG